MKLFCSFPLTRGGRHSPSRPAAADRNPREGARVLHFVPALSGAVRLIQRAYPVAPPTPLPGKDAKGWHEREAKSWDSWTNGVKRIARAFTGR